MILFYFMFVLLFISCSSESQTAGGVIATQGGEEEQLSRIVIRSNSLDTVTAYLFDTEEPYIAIDSTKSRDLLIFHNIATNTLHTVRIQQNNKSNLLHNLQNGDSVSTTLKQTISKQVRLLSQNDTILSAQQAFTPYAQSTIDTLFIAYLLEDTAEFQIKTPSQEVLYSLDVSQKQLLLTPLSKKSLDLQITKGQIDVSIYSLHYDFNLWNKNVQTAFSQYGDEIGTLNTPLETKIESVFDKEKNVLDFNQNAFFSSPISITDTTMTFSITFKAEEDNIGLFQFSADGGDLNKASQWQGYIKDSSLIINYTDQNNIEQDITISAPDFQKKRWITLTLQSNPNGLDLWLNQKKIKSLEATQIAPLPTHFIFGYSNEAKNQGLGYFRGELSQISLFSRALLEGEIYEL